ARGKRARRAAPGARRGLSGRAQAHGPVPFAGGKAAQAARQRLRARSVGTLAGLSFRRGHGMKRKPKDEILDEREVSLLDLVDNVLNRGVVLTGEILLGVADVDLVYVRLAAILCAADKLFPPP